MAEKVPSPYDEGYEHGKELAKDGKKFPVYRRPHSFKQNEWPHFLRGMIRGYTERGQCALHTQ